MTITTLYGGEVLLDFDEAKHVYRVDGQVVPGVTSILGIKAKPALVGWAVKVCGEYLEKHLPVGRALDEIEKKRLIQEMKREHRSRTSDAADIGTIVHKFAEDVGRGMKPEMPVNKEAQSACESFIDWWWGHQVKVLDIERKIYSRKFRYAGTVDLVAEIDGALTIVDYKSGKAIYRDYFLQMGAYSYAYTEETGREADRLMVVRLPKAVEDGFEARDNEYFSLSVKRCELGFLSALNLYKFDKEAA